MAAVWKTPGGVLLVEREWFARLVAQGVSNAEACRIVGINRKTGIRWRYGRTTRNTAGETVHHLPVRVWQRGSNENMNGLLRDYFPKGTDLSTISPAELQQVADERNDRSRKTLGWARPAALIAGVSIRTA